MNNKQGVALFFLRISVFLVMFMWTVDKFINPAHAAAVWGHFYFIKDVGPTAFIVIGSIQMTIILGFVLGIKKGTTYLLVLLMHTVSTLVSYKQYLNPFDGPNLLFFAAWPMLAACFALYLLRHNDTMLSMNIR